MRPTRLTLHKYIVLFWFEVKSLNITIYICRVPPMVLWAQRPSLIILTFCVEDCKEPEIKLESDKLHFKGVGGPDKKQHELTIDFFKDVDTEVRIFNYFMQSRDTTAITSSRECVKGQLILKCLVGIFNSPKKRTQKKNPPKDPPKKLLQKISPTKFH